jgi:UDP-N-acetylglucosamine--N-acetylmuramyl-(pentapeptide) pyrophosphoryl-undecaprenol N-acetylglucosamine transferase
MMLGKKVKAVFTGTEGMEKFFPKGKIIHTGNPVREAIAKAAVNRNEALRFFSLDESKKTVLVVGGSLGARSINEAIDKGVDQLTNAGLQLIWQTGKLFVEKATARAVENKNIWANDFISSMEMAYAAADIVVARAGAMTVAELCVVKKPVVFVPYPFAAEDHQTVNARQLVEKNAARMVKDSEVPEKLIPMVIELAKDEHTQQQLRENIGRMAITNADERIADEILKYLG